MTYDHGDNDDGRAGNGNVADDGTRLYAWDALNRLTAVKRKSDSQPIAAYHYDGLGRRVRRKVEHGGLPNDAGLNGTARNTGFRDPVVRDDLAAMARAMSHVSSWADVFGAERSHSRSR